MGFENLPSFETAGLSTVFQTEADFARTDGKLKHRTRRTTALSEKAAFRNAMRQTEADKVLEVLPGEAESIHLVLDGEFDLHNLIPRIVQLAGETVDSLDLATLGFNDATVQTLAELSDTGKVFRIRMVGSHYFRSVDTDLWNRAHAELTTRGHAVYIARNHAKLQLYRFASGRTVSIISSANLRSCKNAEAAVLFGSPEVFLFWRSVVDELIGEAAKCEALTKGKAKTKAKNVKRKEKRGE